MDDELNNINYHELDYDLNEDINNQNIDQLKQHLFL